MMSVKNLLSVASLSLVVCDSGAAQEYARNLEVAQQTTATEPIAGLGSAGDFMAPGPQEESTGSDSGDADSAPEPQEDSTSADTADGAGPEQREEAGSTATSGEEPPPARQEDSTSADTGDGAGPEQREEAGSAATSGEEPPPAQHEASTDKDSTESTAAGPPQAEPASSHTEGNDGDAQSQSEATDKDIAGNVTASDAEVGADTRAPAQAGLPGAQAGASSDTLLDSQSMRATVNDMRDVVKHAARQHIKDSTAQATEGAALVRSEDRPDGPLKSAAHDRGAVDFRTPQNSPADAQKISQAVGPGHTVIVEKPLRPAPGAPGPSADRHTSYSNGVEGNTRIVSPRATGPHIHVQPEYKINQWPSAPADSKR